MQRYKRNSLNHANNKKIQKTILPQEKMASPGLHFCPSCFLEVGEGGLEPPNGFPDRFTVCCNCHYATPP